VDISNFRPVPDHQEAFTDVHSDQSVIIELLGLEEDVRGDEVPKHYFSDLADVNESTHNEVVSVEHMGGDTFPKFPDAVQRWGIIGKQRVSKFKEASTVANDVTILMCVLRIEEHTTDIVIHMNVPTHLSPEGSSAKSFAELDTEGTVSSSDFLAACRSFEFKDWGLFT
jgi:hypothetical protein